MRRWNGWGDDSEAVPVPPRAAELLAERLGNGAPERDCPLAELKGRVPDSRLAPHPLVSTDPAARATHAAGQSLPDWIALRLGTLARFPDGVAFPRSAAEIRDLLTFADAERIAVIPYGGGTSVAGHLAAPDRPSLSLSLERYDKLISLDARSMLARFQAGATGPRVEAALSSQGFTLGHFPQSFELSSLGGWVATRSCGQQSRHYGTIADLYAGGTVIAPSGDLALQPFPASAAGPDLRHLALGSEGRIGVISEVEVRISPIPEADDVHGIFFPAWGAAVEAARELAATNLPLSMVRFSNPAETRANLALSGHDTLIALLEAYLRLRGIGPDEACMGFIGVTGSRRLAREGAREAAEIAARHGGVWVPKAMGDAWKKNRFRAPYLRNSLWDLGYAVDTLETAVTWERSPAAIAAIEGAIAERFRKRGEKAFVFSHISSIYSSGSSIYTTYLFRLKRDPDALLADWREAKEAASRAIAEAGGTISHQHGVGLDHRPYLPAEKGALGIGALQAAFAHFDPRGIMNPEKLIR